MVLALLALLAACTPGAAPEPEPTPTPQPTLAWSAAGEPPSTQAFIAAVCALDIDALMAAKGQLVLDRDSLQVSADRSKLEGTVCLGVRFVGTAPATEGKTYAFYTLHWSGPAGERMAWFVLTLANGEIVDIA